MLARPWTVVAIATFALATVSIIGVRALPLPARLTAEHSTVIEFADGSPAHVFLAKDEKWRVPVQLENVDPDYLRALIRLEDKRFETHPGVDPVAVLRAAVLNLVRGRRVSGASTLTLQLVRLLEPRPRTAWSKGVEALRALQLELRLSKRDILRSYLQFVPYGRNVEGVEAASLAYFGHGARHLSAAEMATLLAVPQNPNRRYPTADNAQRLQVARDQIADRLAAIHQLPVPEGKPVAAALVELRATPVPTQLRAFPRAAAHAAIWLKAQYPQRSRIRTTLDPGTQRLAERTVTAARAEAFLRGIHNASVVMVDHRSAEVTALVGNFDFWDEQNGGQLVGFANPRSPGSALKPFLYALAIDRGIAGPDFLVTDTPTSFSGYSPRNFDGQYSGLVRLEDALSRSLNIPFVNLLRQIGTEAFLGTLRRMGASSLESDPGHYGLSAAIGGVEISPLELAGLYAALAEEGRYRPLRWLASPHTDDRAGFAAFSPGAAFLTQRALSLKDRPDFPERSRMTGVAPDIHWKTGTSFGKRDAWAAGSDRRHTAVVWMGNFDNTPSSRLVGADAAAPMLFDLLEGAAEKARVVEPARPPNDLTLVDVCAYSGHAATPACPQTKKVWAPRHNVPTTPCPYHVAMDVDIHTGQALSVDCRAEHEHQRRSFLIWPATVRRWLADEQRALPAPPVLAPGCQAQTAHRSPSIVSPAPGSVALLIEGLPEEEQQIPLEAETTGSPAQLSWFIDGQFLAAAPADQRVWWKPESGIHEIWVADDTGASGRGRIEVRRRRP